MCSTDSENMCRRKPEFLWAQRRNQPEKQGEEEYTWEWGKSGHCFNYYGFIQSWCGMDGELWLLQTAQLLGVNLADSLATDG